MSIHEITAMANRLRQQDESLFLGSLFWYSFEAVKVPHAEMVRLLVTAGISDRLPFMPEDSDTFKRVCSAVSRRKLPTSNKNVFENYLMREFRDNNSITRRLVRERVDNKGRKLDFTEMVDFVFERATGLLNHVELAAANEEVNTIIAEVYTEYLAWRGCLGTYTVREWVRKYIIRLGATQVRSGGGVYFLQTQHNPTIVALEVFATAMQAHGYGTLTFHSLPLVDDRKQREMVRQAYEAETIGAVNKSIGEIAALLDNARTTGTKITADRFGAFMTAYHEVGGKTREYGEVLQDELSTTSASLEILQKQLWELAKHVKV